jgi:large conductance mechanosensitive channel
MSHFFKDFRAFLNRGNILDVAVGIAVGGAFTIVVKSLVSNIIMPPIGMAVGDVNFKNLFWVLQRGKTPGPYTTVALAQKAGAVTLNYGQFIDDVLSFLIIGFAVFMLVRYVTKLEHVFSHKEAAAPPTTKQCPRCCSTIAIAATRCPNCTSELASA